MVSAALLMTDVAAGIVNKVWAIFCHSVTDEKKSLGSAGTNFLRGFQHTVALTTGSPPTTKFKHSTSKSINVITDGVATKWNA